MLLLYHYLLIQRQASPLLELPHSMNLSDHQQPGCYAGPSTAEYHSIPNLNHQAYICCAGPSIAEYHSIPNLNHQAYICCAPCQCCPTAHHAQAPPAQMHNALPAGVGCACMVAKESVTLISTSLSRHTVLVRCLAVLRSCRPSSSMNRLGLLQRAPCWGMHMGNTCLAGASIRRQCYDAVQCSIFMGVGHLQT